MNVVIKAFALLVVLIALSLTGCGKSIQAGHIAPEAQPYVDQFLAEAKARGVELTLNVEVVIDDVTLYGEEYNHRTLGFCLSSGKVVLSKLYWDSWIDENDLSKRLLVFHELGHCLLFRAHKDGEKQILNPDTKTMVRAPLSIMNTVFIGGTTYGMDQKAYDDELFDKAEAGHRSHAGNCQH